MTERYFKVLSPDGSCCHGGVGAWPLPDGDTPGEWLDVSGPLVPCRNGLHLCNLTQLPVWLRDGLWEAEYDGERIDAGNKIVVRRARLVRQVAWERRTLIAWATDCAEHVLLLFEQQYPADMRPRAAIDAARGVVADGESPGQLTSTIADAAAAAAAADAATDAATDAHAIRAAVDAAYAADAAATAATYAADAAAAADHAIRAAAAADAAAAYAADAAAGAAYAAAAADHGAAYAAADAADAATDAAGAAGAAAHGARQAERDWQIERLRQYIDGEITP